MTQQTLALTGVPFPFCTDAAMTNSLNQNVLSALRQSLRIRSSGAPYARMTRVDFMDYVARSMPEVQARIEADDIGHAHLEMGAMRLSTRDAIGRDDFRTVYSHFSVIGAWLGYADDDLFDAMVVSYLEALFIDIAEPEYRNARSLLPMNLEEALQQIERHFDLIDSRRKAPQPTVQIDLTNLRHREFPVANEGVFGAVALD